MRNLIAALPSLLVCWSIGLLGAWVCLEVERINDLILETSKEVRDTSKAFSRQMADDQAQREKEWAEAGETK